MNESECNTSSDVCERAACAIAEELHVRSAAGAATRPPRMARMAVHDTYNISEPAGSRIVLYGRQEPSRALVRDSGAVLLQCYWPRQMQVRSAGKLLSYVCVRRVTTEAWRGALPRGVSC